jgi:hypothetical protein
MIFRLACLSHRQGQDKDFLELGSNRQVDKEQFVLDMHEGKVGISRKQGTSVWSGCFFVALNKHSRGYEYDKAKFPTVWSFESI